MQRNMKFLLLSICCAALVWFAFYMEWSLPAGQLPSPVIPEANQSDSLMDSSALVRQRSLPYKDDQTFESLDSTKPLTLAETQRLENWIREKGYLFHLMEGGAAGIPSASGYDAMQDDALRQVAASGDRTAAFTLGQRLLVDIRRQSTQSQNLTGMKPCSC